MAKNKKNETTLTRKEREQFITEFAPALVRILREGGDTETSDEDIVAAARRANSKIVFETPTPGSAVMVACIITDLVLPRKGVVEVVIRKRTR